MYNYVQHVLTAVTRNKLESLEPGFLLGKFNPETPTTRDSRQRQQL